MSRGRVVLLALLALGASTACYGLARALGHQVALLFVFGPFVRVEIGVLVAAAGLSLTALAVEVRDARARATRPPAHASLRALLVVLVLGWALFLWRAQPFQRLWFDMALGVAAGVWAAVVLVLRGAEEPRPRASRTLDFAFFSLCVAAVLLELGLRGYAAVKPSQLLVRVGDAPRTVIERFRCAPGEVRFGFPCNRRGFYDQEFVRREEGERLVVSIGDSFSLGSVPHGWHFSTVCEEALGVPVYSMGVAGIGPREYLRLLVDEALPLDPDLVVIGVFVGNDLTVDEPQKGLPDAWLRSWLQRDRVLLWVLPQRLARIAEERRRRGGGSRPVAAVQGERAGADFPWLADPALEQPTLSAEAHLRLEIQRAVDVCAQDPVSLPECKQALLQARRAAGSTPLLVLLIPDELQVEDELWRAVAEGTSLPLERDRPQRLLAAWLEREGIPFLDLLPVLRAVPPLGDGRRHVYHLQDTHFNARGNRAVGEALAGFVRAHLPP